MMVMKFLTTKKQVLKHFLFMIKSRKVLDIIEINTTRNVKKKAMRMNLLLQKK